MPTEKQSIAAEYVAQLVSRLGVNTVAKRFSVKAVTIQRWVRKGVPPTKVETVEKSFRRSEGSRKAYATKVNKQRRKLQKELANLSVSEQLMRRLQKDFELEQPRLEPTQVRIKVIIRELKKLPGPTMLEVLQGMTEDELERRKYKLLEEFGLSNSRELYTLHFGSGPAYGSAV